MAVAIEFARFLGFAPHGVSVLDWGIRQFANSFNEPPLTSSARQPRITIAAIAIVANIHKS